MLRGAELDNDPMALFYAARARFIGGALTVQGGGDGTDSGTGGGAGGRKVEGKGKQEEGGRGGRGLAPP